MICTVLHVFVTGHSCAMGSPDVGDEVREFHTVRSKLGTDCVDECHSLVQCLGKPMWRRADCVTLCAGMLCADQKLAGMSYWMSHERVTYIDVSVQDR